MINKLNKNAIINKFEEEKVIKKDSIYLYFMDIGKKICFYNLIKKIDDNNTIVNKFILDFKLLITVYFLSELYKDNRKVKKILKLLIETSLISLKKENLLHEKYNNDNILNNLNNLKSEDIEVLNSAIRQYPNEITLGIDNAYCSIGRINIDLKKYNFRELFVIFSSYKIEELLNIINKSELTIHEFAENIVKISKHNKNEKFYNEYFNFLKRILKYNKENFLKLVRYSNYSRVRNSKNLKEALNIVDEIKAARLGINNSKIIDPYMFSKFPKKDYFWFNKELEEINSIGQRTYCCFRKGGAAQSLLKPAYYSPISGIIEGQFKNCTWFSFVWETVEFNKDTNLFDVSLVLDNLEATRRLTKDEMNQIIDIFKSLNKYKKIYLGYLRNDIVQEYLSEIEPTKKPKERSLVEFEKEFNKYSVYDDSKYIFTILENERKEKTNITIKKLNLGDLHRCKYVEWKVWGEYSDTDFVKDVIFNNSFVIQDNQSIFGYLITKKYWYNEEEKNLIFKSRINQELKEKYKEVLYFDDFYIVNNRRIIKSLDVIFEEIKKYIEKNNIKYYSCNCNQFSKNFTKRLDEICEFIPDSRFSRQQLGVTSNVNRMNKTIINEIIFDF